MEMLSIDKIACYSDFHFPARAKNGLLTQSANLNIAPQINGVTIRKNAAGMARAKRLVRTAAMSRAFLFRIPLQPADQACLSPRQRTRAGS